MIRNLRSAHVLPSTARIRELLHLLNVLAAAAETSAGLSHPAVKLFHRHSINFNHTSGQRPL